MMKMNN